MFQGIIDMSEFGSLQTGKEDDYKLYKKCKKGYFESS